MVFITAVLSIYTVFAFLNIGMVMTQLCHLSTIVILMKSAVPWREKKHFVIHKGLKSGSSDI